MIKKKTGWGDFFAKMDEQIAADEARAKARSLAAAPGYCKLWQDQGYRGRILPRHQNLPHDLFPYGNTCRWWENKGSSRGFCRRTINEFCSYAEDARYCPLFSEKMEYCIELNEYHYRKGNIDFLSEWYRKKKGIR